MFDALSIGATGMQAQQLNVDTIANNLANVDTPGYKKGRVSFTDLMATEAQNVLQDVASDVSPAGAPLAVAPMLGGGVGIARVGQAFDAGELRQTGSPLDVAIRGDGFLTVTLADGSRAFTRGGTLHVNADGLLVTQAGQVLSPSITVPANATSVAIAADGHVSIAVPTQTGPVNAGQLDLVRFSDPTALTSLGNGLYRATEGSGEPIVGKAGADGIGTLAQGYIEASNVKMVDEMVNLMVAQRAYEANVKVVQASDDMLGMINNLRK